MLSSLQDEARREALKQRAEQSIHREEPGWEEDEGGSGGGGLGVGSCGPRHSDLGRAVAAPRSPTSSSWPSCCRAR